MKKKLKSKSVMKPTDQTPIAAAVKGKDLKDKVSDVPDRIGRGVPDVTKIYIDECSCNRGKTIVFCRACGFHCNGRIRLTCQRHPRVTFLLDIAECPRCHSSVFLDEYYKNP